MKKWFAKAVSLVLVVVAGGMAVVALSASAQQKFKTSPPDPGSVTKYTEQHVMDVMDD